MDLSDKNMSEIIKEVIEPMKKNGFDEKKIHDTMCRLMMATVFEWEDFKTKNKLYQADPMGDLGQSFAKKISIGIKELITNNY